MDNLQLLPLLGNLQYKWRNSISRSPRKEVSRRFYCRPIMDITNMLNNKTAAERQYQQQLAQGISYPSPASTTSPTDLQPPVPMLGNGFSERPYEQDYINAQRQNPIQPEIAGDLSSNHRHGSEGGVKNFACTTCGKGFARRSDLARHGKNRLKCWPQVSDIAS